MRENYALKFFLGRHSINHPAGCLSSLHCWDVERDSSSINKASRLLAVSYKTAASNSILCKECISLFQYMLKVLFGIIKKQKYRIWPNLTNRSPVALHVIPQLLCWDIFISTHDNTSIQMCQTEQACQWNHIQENCELERSSFWKTLPSERKILYPCVIDIVYHASYNDTLKI